MRKTESDEMGKNKCDGYVSWDQVLAIFAGLVLLGAGVIIINNSYANGQHAMFCKMEGGTSYGNSLPDNQPRGDFYCLKNNTIVTHSNKELE